jgi:hypothetical protein
MGMRDLAKTLNVVHSPSQVDKVTSDLKSLLDQAIGQRAKQMMKGEILVPQARNTASTYAKSILSLLGLRIISFVQV